ncbi:MAG: oxygen-independent coproporphyrinogen III oxidase [Pseudomonadota bacterium]|nr:oxygen-independent coproporphyrinogen III oxidase [Pseudomonadota bacterium]
MPHDPAAILACHGQRAPRYTSYPTAPHFTSGSGSSLQGAFIETLDPKEPVSVYLHIPYCDRLCWFCGCHTKHTLRYEPVARYVDSLFEEIRLFRERVGCRLPLDRVHFGGGSPSMLRSAEFHRLNDALDEAFELLPDAEIAVEIDPSDVTPETLEGLRLIGLNRASIGVQDFDPDVQAAINRPQSFEATRDVVTALRASGLCTVNIDALYGLPRQTPERLMRTIDQVISLEPERVALFGYAHVPWVKTHQKMIADADLPDEAQRFADARVSAERLIEAGYQAVGIDHFAKPGDRLARAAREVRLHRNFQGYTADECRTLIGFGASAISRYPGGYVQNAVPIHFYKDRVAAGALPAEKGYGLSEDDVVRAYAIERLMCDFSVDFADLDARFGAAARPAIRAATLKLAIDPFGLARLEDHRITVSETGRPFTRIVASWFDAYLDEGGVQYSKAV